MKLELVFVPLHVSSHLISAIQFAKLLLHQDERLSVTFLMILPGNQTDLDPQTKLFASSHPRIRITIIPNNITDPPFSSHISVEKFNTLLFQSHLSQVERAVVELVSDDSIQLVGFVLDMFCCGMIDVANKFNVPSYIFFATNTAFLGFVLHLPLRHNQLGVEFHPSDLDLIISTCHNPVPAYVLPRCSFDKTGGGYEALLYNATRYKECKAIIVNSFLEVEPYAVKSIESPSTVYTVGPFLNDNKSTGLTTDRIISWLDNQPPKSVLFLCFGRRGCFNERQLEETAIALERSGHRFLWSVRQPPTTKHTNVFPVDYTNIEKVLPNGFLARVKERGMVCGWTPQVDVLAHEAIKGFVSHCGWNSILESLWYGVPIATWPLYAEQQFNAFLLVRELGLAIELSLSYRLDQTELVMAHQIEKSINLLMDDMNPVRERVKEISEKSRKTLINGGSSLVTLQELIKDMLHNMIGSQKNVK